MLKEYYNKFAAIYDQENLDLENSGLFPYANYHQVLDVIAAYMISHNHLEKMNVLDLGVGTAELYTKISPQRVMLTGVDFAKNMLEIAKLKVPHGNFIEADFVNGLSEYLKDSKFDFIVCTFTIEHMNIHQLVDFIHYYLKYLSPFGKIIIGDILFLDDLSKKKMQEAHPESWTEDIHYHVYNQLVSKIKEHLALSFMKVSEASGVIIIENYHELSLQYEDNLVQYKSNTMKWKSTQTRKKRE